MSLIRFLFFICIPSFLFSQSHLLELDNLQKKILELQKFVYEKVTFDKELIVYEDLPFHPPELRRELNDIKSVNCFKNDNAFCDKIILIENDLLDIDKFIFNNNPNFIVEGLSFPSFQKEDFLNSSRKAKNKISELYSLYGSNSINSIKKKEGFLRSLNSAEEYLSWVFDHSETHYDLRDDITNLFQLYATLDEFKVESKIVKNFGISIDGLEGADLPEIPKQTIDNQELITEYSEDDGSFTPEPLIVEDNNPTKQKQITIVSNEIDNDNPSINCNDYSIFTEERSVNVKCNIQDNDEILKVFVNGNEVEYISELIDVDLNLRYGSQIIQVQAIDVSGNESLVQIEANREFILAEEKKIIEPLNPGLINVPKNNKRIALVIGIKDYKDIDDTKYADTDAQTFIDYAIDTLGIEIGNIKYFINDEAGFLDFATIDRWMNSKIKEDTEVFVFYSGHGANYKGEPLLLPADFRPDLIENSSYNKQDFLEKISAYEPKHIYAFFDACFSGLGREGETLIAGLRNISIVEEEVPFSGITIFNSSSGAEFSRDFDEAGHGLFSYYLMKGLEGKADLNKDKSITTKELHNFISMNVSEQSLNLGIPQNPSLVSNDNRVIVKW